MDASASLRSPRSRTRSLALDQEELDPKPPERLLSMRSSHGVAALAAGDQPLQMSTTDAPVLSLSLLSLSLSLLTSISSHGPTAAGASPVCLLVMLEPQAAPPFPCSLAALDPRELALTTPGPASPSGRGQERPCPAPLPSPLCARSGHRSRSSNHGAPRSYVRYACPQPRLQPASPYPQPTSAAPPDDIAAAFPFLAGEKLRAMAEKASCFPGSVFIVKVIRAAITFLSRMHVVAGVVSSTSF